MQMRFLTKKNIYINFLHNFITVRRRIGVNFGIEIAFTKTENEKKKVAQSDHIAVTTVLYSFKILNNDYSFKRLFIKS